MEIWKAVLLGLVQGVTEFLPVSSSGHLVLLQNVLGVEGEAVLFFDVMVHVGTLVAVLVALKEPVLELVRRPFSKPVFNLVIATIPAGIVGVVLDEALEGLFGGEYLFVPFMATAVILLITDFVVKRAEGKSEITTGVALAMGVGQALAVVPGLSRSGTTIATGIVVGGEKSRVADFSFLMSVPVILGAAVLETRDLMLAKCDVSAMLLPTAFGMITAGLAGYFAVKWMLKLVKKRRLWGFSVYLTALAVLTFVNHLTGFMW